ncbi:hypothetical protein LJK88_09160 [Paenibacillus sp. P26]|nr:hypothetical protein LJK88_09160 [Paenibacillus sp. P26]UUZ89942.1 hypothetical protein LJK87_28420 [Paenibacillus sp. P25]
MKVTDNFGIIYEQDEIQGYNFALGTTFLVDDVTGDPKLGPTGTVTVGADGTVQITGNVTEFTLTAAVPTGKRATSIVEVHRQ